MRHFMRENVFPCSKLMQEGVFLFVLIYAKYTFGFILIVF